VICILVVDDHPIVRQGLVAALEDEPDFAVVGAAGSAEEALALAANLRPDVVLLDLELPGMSGVAAIPRLLDASPATRVLIFTAYDTEERVLGALRAGAKGYLLKGATAAEIAGAVRAVAGGGSALEPRIAARLVTEMSAPRSAARHLTTREREVLRLIAAGQSGKQIARALGISERTVKFHTTALMRKLGADNRAQAVALALQRGLIDVPRDDHLTQT
jgi:DNA-binding NarL/FixJ family response regulator